MYDRLVSYFYLSISFPFSYIFRHILFSSSDKVSIQFPVRVTEVPKRLPPYWRPPLNAILNQFSNLESCFSLVYLEQDFHSWLFYKRRWHFNSIISVFNHFRSYVGPRPTLWFSCSRLFSWSLTLSNPIFLPTAYSPTLIYFGRERGWWVTCNYHTVFKEKNTKRNRKSTTCAICWLKSVLHEEKLREQENHIVGLRPTLWFSCCIVLYCILSVYVCVFLFKNCSIITSNTPSSFPPKINKSWGVCGWQKNWIGNG
jgi:hypothetical protein